MEDGVHRNGTQDIVLHHMTRIQDLEADCPRYVLAAN